MASHFVKVILVVSDSVLIGSNLGVVSFLLLAGVVVVVVCICCYVRHYSYVVKKDYDL